MSGLGRWLGRCCQARCQAPGLTGRLSSARIGCEGDFDMPRTPRAEQFDPNQVCIVHLVQRCIRKAYLAGFDVSTGIDYSHRREWIRARMERLASVFGMDVLTYAILSNHLHLVARTRPDVVREWSDSEVALRWLRIFPGT